MSLKSKLRLLYQEMSAEYQRFQNATNRRLTTERFSSYNQIGEAMALDCILGLFRKYIESVNEELKERKSNDDYEQLEKALQTQEAEIRNHIRLEQQMKLYAESLQSKLEESEKMAASQAYLQTKTIQSLKKELERLQEEKKEQKSAKQRELSSLVNTQAMRYSSKQKGYGSIRYDTENRKTLTPTKQVKKDQNSHISTSFLGRSCSPYQDITNSVHAKTQADEKQRSASREEGIKKGGMKGSSIQIMANKNNFVVYNRK